MNSSVIGKSAEGAVSFLFAHFSGGFNAFSSSLDAVVMTMEKGLTAVPFAAMAAIFVALSLWRRGVAFAIFVGLALSTINYMGLWTQTVSTLALVIAEIGRAHV